MANEIDERVVSMRFDNSQFEKNTQKSLSTIEKLKTALRFEGAQKGFDSVEKRASKLSLNPAKTAIDSVVKKFSVMEIAGVTAIANITNSVVNLGKRMARSLSLDQVNAGWDKYARKTTAVATLVSATRSDYEDAEKQMEDINEQLEKMLWFTDETSYNFTDMVDNMGKFISNGVKLDKAATAMEGVATWAAASGQNASTASRVMYNLSQAVGLGAVTLVDWRSIELANMATVEFKQNVIDVAKEMGKLPKGVEVTTETFRESLSEKWFDADVLSEVLSRYGSFSDKMNEVTSDLDLTATETLRYMDQLEKGTLDVGEAAERTGKSEEELVKILTELNSKENEVGRNAFKMAQEARTFSDAMEAIKDGVSTAWMRVFETVFGGYDEAKKLWTNLANWGYDVFAEPVNKLNDRITEFKEAGGFEEIKEGFSTIKSIASSMISPVTDVFKALFPKKDKSPLQETLKSFDLLKELDPDSIFSFEGIPKSVVLLHKLNTNITKLKENTENWLNAFKDSNGIGRLAALFRQIASLGKALFKPVKDGFTEVFGRSPLKKVADRLKSALRINPKQLSDGITFLTSRLGDFQFGVESNYDAIKDRFKGLFDFVANFGERSRDILSKLKDKILSVRENFTSFGDAFSKIKNFAVKAFQKIGESAPKVFDKIKEAIANAFSGKSVSDILSDVFTVGIGGGLTLALFNIGKFFKGLSTGDIGIFKTIKEFFSSLIDSLKTKSDFADSLRDISVSIAILAGSLLLLAMINPDSLRGAIGAVLIMVTSLVAVITQLNSLSTGSEKIGNLGDALKRHFDNKELSKIGTNLIKFAASILILSIALAILVPVIRNLGEMDLATLGQGLGAVIVLLAAFGGLSVMVEKLGGSMKGMGGAMLLMSVSMLIFTAAIKKLGEMDVEALRQGMAAIIVIMAAFGGLSVLINKLGGKLMATAGAMLIASAAIAIMAGSLAALSALNPGKLENAMTMLGILLVVIGVLGLTLGTMSNDFLKVSAGMLIISTAILVLVAALGALAIIPYDRLLNNLVLFGGVMIGLVAAGMIANAIVPGLLALSAALVAFGLAAVGIGAGIALIATGFSILAVAGPAGISILTGALLSIIGLIPVFATAVAQGIILFATTIMNGASVLAKAVVVCIVAIIESVAEGAGDILNAVVDLIIALIKGVFKLIPALIDTGKTLIKSIFKGAKDESKSAENEAESVGEGIGEGLQNGIESGADGAKDILGEAISGITDGAEAPDLSSMGGDMMNSLMSGTDGINLDSLMPEMDISSLNLEQYGGDAVGQEFIDTVASGMEANSESAKKSFVSVIEESIEAVKTKDADFMEAGINGVAGLINGMISKKADAYAAGETIGKQAVAGVKAGMDENSPSKATFEAGVFADLGLINGLLSLKKKVTGAGTELGESAIDGVNMAVASVYDAISDGDYQPVIRPVVDLSDVEKSAGEVSGYFGSGTSFGIASYTKASKVGTSVIEASGIQNGAGTSYTNVNNIYPQQVNNATVDYLFNKFNRAWGR